MFKTPKFWYEKSLSLMAVILYPVGLIYVAGSKFLGAFSYKKKFGVPILSIGNLVVGGSGKTPTTIAIANALQKRGVNIAIVSRGYGGSLAGPIRVDCKLHDYQSVGDEPILMSKIAPVYVAKDRTKGIELAISDISPDLIILDDGHQTKGIHKDFKLLVFDKKQGVGNGLPFPAGPMREPLKCGLSQVDKVLIIDNGEGDFDLPNSIEARMETTTKGKGKVIAFCGLGFPLKFKTSLEKAGYELQEFIEFPDHHPYTRQEIEAILAKRFPVFTTEKDLLRVPVDLQQKITVLPIAIKFKTDDLIDDLVKNLQL